MTSEIIALRCPSCGSAASDPSRQLHFGAEFTCHHCGVVSVLIIDRALVQASILTEHGEKVCSTCGRVALREARYCQEGHALIRKCLHRSCKREFPVEHQRCDFCGQLQPAPPTLPVIKLTLSEIDPQVRILVPTEMARQHNIVPIRRAGTTLTIAMADPMSFFLMEELEFMTGYTIEPTLAAPAEVASAIQQQYGPAGPSQPRR